MDFLCKSVRNKVDGKTQMEVLKGLDPDASPRKEAAAAEDAETKGCQICNGRQRPTN